MIKTLKELFKRKKEVKISIDEYLTVTTKKDRRILKDSEIPMIAEHKALFVLGQCKSRKYTVSEITGRIEYSRDYVEGFALFPITYEQHFTI